jgi:chromosome segregation ATPase
MSDGISFSRTNKFFIAENICYTLGKVALFSEFNRQRREHMMSNSITDIENGLLKIETLIRGLFEDRDEARAEITDLKRALDDRELELLALDEAQQNMKNDYERQIAESSRAREELELKLEDLASKVMALMPLAEEYSSENKT